MNQNYRAWLSSFRLQTLPLALATIMIANALAYWKGDFDGYIFILTLLTATLLQLTSNLANDYGDCVKQSDTEDRVGPIRGIHLGLITLPQLKKALYCSVSISMILGVWLLIVATENIMQFIVFIALGGLSIIAAITYTVGKRPYGYMGLGDFSVLIFFGFVGVLGSYYLQTNTLPRCLIWPAISSGCLSMGVLNINNMRDYEQDKKVGKRTFAVILGLESAKFYQMSLLIISLGALSIFMISYLPLKTLWVLIILLPLYFLQIYYLKSDRKPLAAQLLPMVRLSLITALLLSISLVMVTAG